jgi:hypothetical protein
MAAKEAVMTGHWGSKIGNKAGIDHPGGTSGATKTTHSTTNKTAGNMAPRINDLPKCPEIVVIKSVIPPSHSSLGFAL